MQLFSIWDFSQEISNSVGNCNQVGQAGIEVAEKFVAGVVGSKWPPFSYLCDNVTNLWPLPIVYFDLPVSLDGNWICFFNLHTSSQLPKRNQGWCEQLSFGERLDHLVRKRHYFGTICVCYPGQVVRIWFWNNTLLFNKALEGSRLKDGQAGWTSSFILKLRSSL